MIIVHGIMVFVVSFLLILLDFFLFTITYYSTHIGNTLEAGDNPIVKVPLQVENINGNLMITTLFDDDTDEDVGKKGTLVVATIFIQCMPLVDSF